MTTQKIRLFLLLVIFYAPKIMVASSHLPLQNTDPIANFALNEDDTTRYAHHYLYERAYSTIEDMLTDRCPIDLAEAIYAIENSFYDGALDYESYLSEISRITDGVLSMSVHQGATAPSHDVALNTLIFDVFNQNAFNAVVSEFKTASNANAGGLYNKYPLVRSNQTQSLIKQFYPIYR